MPFRESEFDQRHPNHPRAILVQTRSQAGIPRTIGHAFATAAPADGAKARESAAAKLAEHCLPSD